MMKDNHSIDRNTRSTLFLILFLIIIGCTNEQQNLESSDSNSLSNSYLHDFKIGVALNHSQVAGEIPRTTPLIRQHFNSITPENLLKWERVHPNPDEYNFTPVDTFVEFGVENKMFIVGHTLVWHSQVPDWVFETENGDNVGREELLQRMRNHIQTVAGRYRGRIDGWDVVNEAVLDEGGMRESKWYQLVGEDYVQKAFEYAGEAAPDAELYYNDYNLWIPEKREATIALVKSLLENNIRIDGIGMQAHLKIDTPSIEMMEESIIAFSELGLKVMITELDIDLLPREEQADVELPENSPVPDAHNPFTENLPDSMHQELADRYSALFELFKKHSDKIERVTFWGLNDGQSWLNNFPIRGRTNYPLLFDREFEAKPAFEAVLEAAKD
ncbi:MAG: endo-1,4-beta-xylanase [Balneolaceae bacterium]|nr:endo-1,4-beta-xylanase [Balneolaceae bacterium]MDR9410064.1 endo-1,4-beta-xylanase [Balneolaceae bacterium]